MMILDKQMSSQKVKIDIQRLSKLIDTNKSFKLSSHNYYDR